MKVIEKHYGKRLTCENCQSILEYINEDIKYEGQIYGKRDQYIVCPVCGYENYIVIY